MFTYKGYMKISHDTLLTYRTVIDSEKVPTTKQEFNLTNDEVIKIKSN